MTFPELGARDLNGVSRRLPGALPGDPTVVIVAFRMHHQTDVDTWLPLFEDVPVVELPMLDASEEGMANFIEQGMRLGVRDHEARARTWTAYTDLGAFPLGASPIDPREILVLGVRPARGDPGLCDRPRSVRSHRTDPSILRTILTEGWETNLPSATRFAMASRNIPSRVGMELPGHLRRHFHGPIVPMWRRVRVPHNTGRVGHCPARNADVRLPARAVLHASLRRGGRIRAPGSSAVGKCQ